MKEIRKTARERMKGYCRVCPVCNGKACAGEVPGIATAVKGQIAILADGGVRTGGDVLKMIALGADAVMIGRPFAIAAVGGLKGGVVKYIDQLKSELQQAMVLTGCRDIRSVGSSILY